MSSSYLHSQNELYSLLLWAVGLDITLLSSLHVQCSHLGYCCRFVKCIFVIQIWACLARLTTKQIYVGDVTGTLLIKVCPGTFWAKCVPSNLYCMVHLSPVFLYYPSPGMVAELIEPRVWVFGSSVPFRVKPMTYQIDTCYFLAWCSALIGLGKDWLAQCWDNVIEWAWFL